MSIQEPYIPREHLALQINYCKQQLAALPEVSKTYHMLRGNKTAVFKSKNRTITASTQAGREMEKYYELRESLSCKLSKLEGLWDSLYRGLPPSDFAPRNVKRKMFISSTESVILDEKFFESLKNDADPNHRESKTCFYNGIYYRSTQEVDIARYYTENDMPFKYEPEIWLKGLNYPIYTDFVLLIKELNLCKFHEHFGMKNAADYNRLTATKYNNYSGAGLVPGLDIIYTYDFPGIPFDLRSVPVNLNAAIYSSLFLPNVEY